MANERIDYNIFRDTISRIAAMAHDDNGKNVTFTFEGSNEKVTAHKCILEAVSPVFKTMFSGSFAEKDEVKITDIEPKIFQLLIR